MANEQIQRFGFWHYKEWAGQPGEFELIPEGPYVLHADHLSATNAMRENQAVLAQEVDAKDAEIAALKAEVSKITDEAIEWRDRLRQMTECRDDLNRLVAQREADVERLSAPLSDLYFVDCNEGYHCRHYSNGGFVVSAETIGPHARRANDI